VSGTVREGKPMLTADMVLDAFQAIGNRYATTSELTKAVRAANPEVIINKGATNSRLKRLVALGKVHDIQDPRRGIDPQWELLA
jgi:hypothetical protein